MFSLFLDRHVQTLPTLLNNREIKYDPTLGTANSLPGNGMVLAPINFSSAWSMKRLAETLMHEKDHTLFEVTDASAIGKRFKHPDTKGKKGSSNWVEIAAIKATVLFLLPEIQDAITHFNSKLDKAQEELDKFDAKMKALREKHPDSDFTVEDKEDVKGEADALDVLMRNIWHECENELKDLRNTIKRLRDKAVQFITHDDEDDWRYKHLQDLCSDFIGQLNKVIGEGRKLATELQKLANKGKELATHCPMFIVFPIIDQCIIHTNNCLALLPQVQSPVEHIQGMLEDFQDACEVVYIWAKTSWPNLPFHEKYRFALPLANQISRFAGPNWKANVLLHLDYTHPYFQDTIVPIYGIEYFEGHVSNITKPFDNPDLVVTTWETTEIGIYDSDNPNAYFDQNLENGNIAFLFASAYAIINKVKDEVENCLASNSLDRQSIKSLENCLGQLYKILLIDNWKDESRLAHQSGSSIFSYMSSSCRTLMRILTSEISYELVRASEIILYATRFDTTICLGETDINNEYKFLADVYSNISDSEYSKAINVIKVLWKSYFMQSKKD
jgi:hypothetical protein